MTDDELIEAASLLREFAHCIDSHLYRVSSYFNVEKERRVHDLANRLDEDRMERALKRREGKVT